MDSALSLKTGEAVRATVADYTSQRRLLLVCPECGEPVHLVERRKPQITKYFAHPDLRIERGTAGCSLRVLGASFRPASSLIPGLSHGQFTDRFQAKAVFEVLNVYGNSASAVQLFARAFIAEESPDALGRNGRKSLSQLLKSGLPPWVDRIAELDAEQKQFIDEALSDVLRFLNSAYGGWVLSWLVAISRLTSAAISRAQLTPAGIVLGASIGTRAACLVIEKYRFNNITANGVNLAEYLVGQRAKAVDQVLHFLIIHTIVRWRNPNRLTFRSAIIISDSDVARKPSVSNTKSESPPAPARPVSAPTQAKTKSVSPETPTRASLASKNEEVTQDWSTVRPRGTARWPAFQPTYWQVDTEHSGTRPQIQSAPGQPTTSPRKICPSCKRSIGLDLATKSYYCLECHLTFSRT
jgi:ribosomal protein L37AE/L43A